MYSSSYKSVLRFGAHCRKHHQIIRCYAVPSDFNVLEGVAEESKRVRVNGYDETGFTVNGIDISSSVVCVGGLAGIWKPKTISDITPESLALFELLEPRPELLLLGCGEHVKLVNPEVCNYLRSKGIKLEALPTRIAASTFNMLSEEGRSVAAALLIAVK